MARKTNPHANSRLAKLIERRIAELAPIKSQRDIALESGYLNVNILSMIKSGATKPALDRIPALAAALDLDPAHLFLLALEQDGHRSLLDAIEKIFRTPVTENEVTWLRELRDASENTDPRLTRRARAALRGIFNK